MLYNQGIDVLVEFLFPKIGLMELTYRKSIERLASLKPSYISESYCVNSGELSYCVNSGELSYAMCHMQGVRAD